MKTLGIQVLPTYEGLWFPEYAHEGDSGFDLRSVDDAVLIMPGETRMIPTGLKFVIPEGYEVQVRPRSGLAAKEGLTVLNTPGTIDRGYTGEVKVLLHNTGKEPHVVARGDRIAQAVMAPVERATLYLVDEDGLEVTERGDGGFGSTGTA